MDILSLHRQELSKHAYDCQKTLYSPKYPQKKYRRQLTSTIPQEQAPNIPSSIHKQRRTFIGEYLYNGLNKRVYKHADGKSTYYFHGKDNETLSEMDENGISLADYIYLNGKMVAKVVPDKIN